MFNLLAKIVATTIIMDVARVGLCWPMAIATTIEKLIPMSA